jgi:uncharacterized integral membrane protein (TIGR00697 family)
MKSEYKYLMFLSMLSMTIKLTTVVLIYKIIKIGGFSASASTLIIPIWFILGDLIAEVYGYKTAKQVIWIAMFCQLLFALLCSVSVTLPSPFGWPDQEIYTVVFQKLPRVVFSSIFAILLGAFINAYIITRWKILLKGKYFLLRCLGASAIGELIFTISAYLIEFFGMVSLSHIFQLMIVSYSIKLILNLFFSIPVASLANWLKTVEKIDVDDFKFKFNPFSKLNNIKKIST